MADYTLSYSNNAQGWPSFYSFDPEYMRGMNSFFYTWKDGNMYRHNVNARRNEYYGEQYSSTIQSVINDSPQDIKLFKTMSLEGDRSWECTALSTNLSVGSMSETYFEEKEGEWFTFIRSNIGTKDFKLRSTNGIGQCTQVLGSGVSLQLFFTVPLGDILSVGDYAYSTAIDGSGVATGTSLYVGQVVAVDKADGFIQVNMTVFEPSDNPPGPVGTLPTVTDFIFFYKNAVSESHGARGFYLSFTLKNEDTIPMELFAVGADVMQSYP